VKTKTTQIHFCEAMSLDGFSFTFSYSGHDAFLSERLQKPKEFKKLYILI